MSPTRITVSVIADTGSPLRPGLFQGSVDGVKAWASYINANGGLACRQVVVKALDSKLSSDDALNAMTTACGDSLALVGTTAVFLTDMGPAEQCKDKTGNATGMPDLAVLQTSTAQQCSPISWPAIESSGNCPYSGSGTRTFNISTTTIDYYLHKYGKGALHGVYLVPKDLPSTIASTTPIFAAQQQEGIRSDAELGVSTLDPQSGYTPFVEAIKTNKSTFARDGADYVSNVFLRKEAQVQGVDTVKVWDCSLQCYDQRLISTGGSAVEGQYTWLSFLPFEDKGHNAELDAFLEYDKTPDAFGAQAWVAGEMFAAAVKAIVAKDGPNGLTRRAMLGCSRQSPSLRRRRIHRADRYRWTRREQMPDRYAGAARQVRTRRSGRARHVRLPRSRHQGDARSGEGLQGIVGERRLTVAAPDWRAPFHECGRGFGHVAGRARENLCPVFHVNRGFDVRRVDVRPHHLLVIVTPNGLYEQIVSAISSAASSTVAVGHDATRKSDSLGLALRRWSER